jgi:hypothetical protein
MAKQDRKYGLVLRRVALPSSKALLFRNQTPLDFGSLSKVKKGN